MKNTVTKRHLSPYLLIVDLIAEMFSSKPIQMNSTTPSTDGGNTMTSDMQEGRIETRNSIQLYQLEKKIIRLEEWIEILEKDKKIKMVILKVILLSSVILLFILLLFKAFSHGL